MKKTYPSLSKKGWRILRWLTAAIGLALFVIGQHIIASDITPAAPPLQLGEWLNNYLKLNSPSIDNVLNGLPILLAGAAFLILAFRGLQLIPSEKETDERKPFAIRKFLTFWPWVLCIFVLFGMLLWLLATRDYQPMMAIGWLIDLLLATVVMATWDHERDVSLSPGLARQDILWIVGIILAGIVIGTYRLQAVPDALMGDEGNFWTVARDIANGTFKPAIFATGVYTFPVLSSCLQAVMIKVFGLNLWGWRFSSVLSGVVTVAPLYLLAREAFNRKVAIASCIALILSPYFLVFERLGYNNIQALFITTLTLYWLYIGLKRISGFYLFLAGCAAGLGFYTYFAARGALVIAILFIGVMWIVRKVNFRQVTFALVFLAIGSILITGPYFIYGINHDAPGMGFKTFESLFFNTFNGRQFYTDQELFAVAPPITINGNELFYNPKIYAILIARGFIRSLLAFQKPWLISEHYIAFPLAGTVGVIFYLIGLGVALQTIHKPRSLLLMLWFLTYIVGFSTLNTVPPRHTHMVAILPAIAILTGVGMVAIANAASVVHVKLEKHKSVLLTMVLLTVSIGGLIDYFITMPRKYYPQPDQIISWATLYAGNESFYYIYTNPDMADFKPYIVAELRQDVPFTTLPLENFKNESPELTGGNKAVIFYSPDIAGSVEPVMFAAWGNQFIKRIFYSTDGTMVLVAGMNTPFIFPRDQSLLTSLQDSYLRLPLLILLGILMGLIMLAAFIPSEWTRRLPNKLKGVVTWFNTPEHPEVEEPVLILPSLAEAIGESHDIPIKDTSMEPPEWVEQNFPVEPIPVQNNRFKVEIVQTGSEDGKDYYFRLHLPSIKEKLPQLPESITVSLPRLDIPNVFLLIAAVLLAIVAQALIYTHNYTIGIILYILSAIGLIAWIYKRPKWSNVFSNQLRISLNAEILLVIALMLLTAVTRYYDLGYRVYGLEADETKWTVQSWYSTILRVDKGEFAEMHYKYLPVDFWVRSVFLRVFGLNFISARLESATISLFSVLFLYLLVRRLTASPPTALFSALLYGFSFVELEASHQALHNTPLEIWMMSGFYMMVLAIQQKKWWQFQLAGILMALGMMTYETFFPTPIIALVYLIGLAIYQIVKKKVSIRHWLQYLALFLWPILIVYFIFTKDYLQARQGYDLGWLMNSTNNGANLLGLFHFITQNTRDWLTTIFSSIVWTDSLLRWTGPFLNPILLPFIVIGLINNLWNIRRPHFAFIPLWYLIQTLIAPIALGSVWPRVLYTGLAPLIIWGAMGLWVCLGMLRGWFDGLNTKLAVPIFVLLILSILTSDYYIFTSALPDPVDRIKRRELADLTAQSANEVPMLLFPYEPVRNDSVEVESHVILFSVAGARHTNLEAQTHFQQIPYDQLLLSLWQNRQLDGLDLFYDKTADTLTDDRQAALNVVLSCYPDTTLETIGTYFNVYHFSHEALSQPVCYQAPSPSLVLPADGSQFPTGIPVRLYWDNGSIMPSSFSVTVERKATGIYLLEAEDTFQGNGWYSSGDFVTDYTGNGFLLDGWQSGETTSTFDVPQGGKYRIWIRSYKRQINDQHNFVTINGKTLEFAGDKNTLNEWVWEDLGLYDLSAGNFPIALKRTYGQDEEYSVFIDSILISSDTTHSPDQINLWDTVYTSGEVNSSASQFNLPDMLSPGEYRWNVRVYEKNRLEDSNGTRGVEMPFANFVIQP